jgi:ribose-phosphate pyrophosphokinase
MAEKVEFFNHGELGIIVMESAKDLGAKVNQNIAGLRNTPNVDYRLPITETRFQNGEGKVRLNDSVRGKDIFIISDVGNYSCTYDLYGYENHVGPDEHFQSIKRVLSAIGGKANRVTVIMPLLYSSRQHKRHGRESLDCAMSLRELEALGVNTILTFDAHDPTIHNAIPVASFENVFPTYSIIKEFIRREGVKKMTENMAVISPDVGAMDRAVYYANILGHDVGVFYKRRDLDKVVDGKSQIVQHEYIGKPLDGKSVLIIDDMIASGGSIIEVIERLSQYDIQDVYSIVTFPLFTKGVAAFDKLYEEGKLKKLYSTNLTYVPKEIVDRPWFEQVDLSKYIAKLINTLNHDHSISGLLDADVRTKEMVQKAIRAAEKTDEQ